MLPLHTEKISVGLEYRVCSSVGWQTCGTCKYHLYFMYSPRLEYVTTTYRRSTWVLLWYPVYLVDNIPWIHCELSQPTVCGLVLIAIERGKLKLWQARIGGVALSLLQVIPATWNRATLDLQSILPYLSLYYQRMQLYTRTLLKLLLCALADWYLQFSIDHLHEDWWGWAATTHTLNYTAFIN